MKKHIIAITILSALFSCKKSWLEIVPQGDQVAVTTDDYGKLMNNPDLYNYPSGGWGEAQLMGDEVAAETPYFANINIVRDRLFQWKDSIYVELEHTPFLLSFHNRDVYGLNKVINEVMSSTGGTDEQKRAIRAEALATRAWCNFNMAGHYCKPYNAATAATDPGFPLITEADVNTRSFPRGTVQETYDFIIKDLTDALVSIPVRQPIVTRMSKPAVEGLLGKVYLFMGRYNEALPFLNAAISSVTANGQTSFYNYNETFAPGGAFLPVNTFSGPNSPGQNQNDFREAVVSKVWSSGSYSGNVTGNNGLVLTPQAAALYGSSDFRLLFYTDTNSDMTPNPAGRLRKYGVSYSRFGLQLADLYLLAAECKARLNDPDGAVADLEMLRKNRMPPADAVVPAAIAADQAALVRFIIDERTREFAAEGYRWFDMRRLSVDPLFAGTVYTHTMYNEDGTTMVYTLDQSKRFVLKFPRNYTDTNPDMPDNP